MEKKEIIQAIQKAECETSGEIRLHLEGKVEGDPIEHAKAVFENIGMTATEQKNGVLILLCVASRRFVILGDKGIDDKVPNNFWDEIVIAMQSKFKQDNFADGLIDGINKIGENLKAFFPYQKNDVNELSDEISYSR